MRDPPLKTKLNIKMMMDIIKALSTPYGKELGLLGKLSADILFIEKMLLNGKKKWTDVEKEVYDIHKTLKNKPSSYTKFSQDEKERLLCFVDHVIANCEKVQREYNP